MTAFTVSLVRERLLRESYPRNAGARQRRAIQGGRVELRVSFTAMHLLPYQDGPFDLYSVLMIERLPACYVEVPEVPDESAALPVEPRAES